MRVLLVTWTDQLLQKLSILNPQLEYCAVVVDEVEPAKKILERLNMPKSLLRPMYELKECVRDFYYDYVLCVENSWADDILKTIQTYDVPKDKMLNLGSLNSVNNFLLERSLRYFKEHAAEFEMFATGISYVEKCFDVTRFKRKLFNFGRGSQDLYYNFQVAKRAVECSGGGRIRYALIGLAPYIFYYDLSNAYYFIQLMLQYFIALKDLHNFYVPAEVYSQFLRKEYLEARLPLEPFDLNDPYLVKNGLPMFMKPKDRLNARKIIDGWAEKNYPETRTENIQILDDYLTLCEQNNIRPIMFLPPFTEGYIKLFNRRKLDEFHCIVRQACKKHPSALFLDGWQLRGMADRDFYDVFHLNLQGAAKFSMYFNHFLEQLDDKQ